MAHDFDSLRALAGGHGTGVVALVHIVDIIHLNEARAEDGSVHDLSNVGERTSALGDGGNGQTVHDVLVVAEGAGEGDDTVGCLWVAEGLDNGQILTVDEDDAQIGDFEGTEVGCGDGVGEILSLGGNTGTIDNIEGLEGLQGEWC